MEYSTAPITSFFRSLKHFFIFLTLYFISLILIFYPSYVTATSSSSSSSILKESHENTHHRILYDLNIGGLITDSVLTYSTVTDPVGIVIGQFHGYKGLFISSFFTHSIYFISLDHQGHTKTTMNPIKISGGSDSIDLDGSLTSASYAEPSRMAFDHTCNYLFVATRRTLKIRLLNLGQGIVTTLQSDGHDISYGTPSQYSIFPGIDIQNIDNQYLFIAVGNKLYRIYSSLQQQQGHQQQDSTSFCSNIATSAINEEYGSVSKYLEYNNYGDNARVYSVAPDKNRGYLYVAICDQRNLILKVPIDAVMARDYTSIIRLLGVDTAWSGDTSIQQPPVSSNGYAQQTGNSAVKLAFPMHLQYDEDNQYLYWSECFPYAGDFLLGSLAIRRLSLISGNISLNIYHNNLLIIGLVDMYAGVDFTKDMETYSYMGTQGGYVDGEVNVAEFKYPISFAFANEEDNLGIASGVLYVADRFNNAIRRVANIVDTPAPSISFAPTPAPTISYCPTEKPTRRPSSHRPTISISPTYSVSPTHSPTESPSYSLEPTFNPTKRPSKKPTFRPTHKPTFSPTKVHVIVEDVSLFHNLGLGTFHVTIGAMALSLVIGLFLAGMIVAGYIYRSRNPHRRLRTSELDISNSSNYFPDDDSDNFDFTNPQDRTLGSYLKRFWSIFKRKCTYLTSLLGAVIWGRIYSLADDDLDDIGGGMELSVNGSHHSTNSTSSMSRILQTIRENSNHSSRAYSSTPSSQAQNSPYSSSSSFHPSLTPSTSSIRITSLSHGSDGL